MNALKLICLLGAESTGRARSRGNSLGTSRTRLGAWIFACVLPAARPYATQRDEQSADSGDATFMQLAAAVGLTAAHHRLWKRGAEGASSSCDTAPPDNGDLPVTTCFTPTVSLYDRARALHVCYALIPCSARAGHRRLRGRRSHA